MEESDEGGAVVISLREYLHLRKCEEELAKTLDDDSLLAWSSWGRW